MGSQVQGDGNQEGLQEIELSVKLKVPAHMPEDVFMDKFLSWAEQNGFEMMEATITMDQD